MKRVKTFWIENEYFEMKIDGNKFQITRKNSDFVYSLLCVRSPLLFILTEIALVNDISYYCSLDNQYQKRKSVQNKNVQFKIHFEKFRFRA